MRFETRTVRFGTFFHIVPFVLFFFLFSHISVATERPLESSSKFSNSPSGIIRAIIDVNDSVFIGAENGLFKITGDQVVIFDDTNSPLGKGYITSLDFDGDNTLLITEYGSGAYLFDISKQSFHKVDVSSSLLLRAWKGKISENYIALTTINDFLLIDLEANTLHSASSVLKQYKLESVFEVAKSKDGSFWFSDSRTLFEILPSSLVTKAHDIATTFPLLDDVSHISLHNSKIFVGGVSGIYISDLSLKNLDFIKKPLTHAYPIDDIEFINEKSLIVASGGLLELDLISNRFKTFDFFYPLLDEQRIRTVTALQKIASGDIIFATTQLGLSYIPTKHQFLNYLFEGEANNRPDIDYTFLSTGEYTLATSELNIFHLNKNTGELKKVSARHSKSKALVFIGANSFLNLDSCSTLKLTDDGQVLESAAHPLRSYCDELSGVQSYTSNGKNFISYLKGDEERVIEFGLHGDLIRTFPVPSKPYKMVVNNAGELLFSDDKNHIYHRQNNGVWVKHELEQLGQSLISCMYTDSADIIWLCTSGQGLIGFDPSDGRSFSLNNEARLRFIRGSVYQDGAHWVGSNKGLKIYLSDGSSLNIGPEIGVNDTDFGFDGIEVLSEGVISIIGDKQNYILDTKKALSYLSLRKNRKSEVKITSLVFTHSFNSNERYNQIDYNYSIDESNVLELAYFNRELHFTFSSIDFSQSSGQQVEYRMRGYEEEWTRLPTSYGEATYHSLPIGELTFEVRVVDPRSEAIQPVSVIPIRVMPPFWLTWQAFIVYALLLMWWAVVFKRWVNNQVAKRNIELSELVNKQQGALDESNSSIKRLLEKKQTLFTNLSHELRTPITLIAGFVTQIKMHPNDKENSNRIERIQRNTQRLTRLVDQLMEVEQLDKIKDIPTRAYDIEQQCQLIFENVKPLAHLKQQRITMRLDVKGNFVLLQDTLDKVLYNLLMNAINYTPEKGQVELVVSMQQGQLELVVTDTGQGIPEDEIDYVFERFTRLSSSETVKGSGVGLAMVKDLIMANEGWITVASKWGEGTTFVVTLPANEVDYYDDLSSLTISDYQRPQLIESSVEEPLLETDEPQQKPILLIAEDNADMRHYLFSLFKSDYACYVASDGVDAMKVALSIVPDLIITDLLMPHLDGEQLSKQIREHELLSSTPILMLTAKGDKNTRINSLKAEVDDFISKPFEQDELIIRVKNMLSNRVQKARKVKSTLYDKQCVAVSAQLSDEKDQTFYLKFIDVLEKHFSDDAFTRSHAADYLAMSERQLNRKLETLIDGNFVSFLRQFRLQKAREMLESGGQVAKVAYDVGFTTPSYFSNCFKQQFGCSPKAYALQQSDLSTSEDQ